MFKNLDKRIQYAIGAIFIIGSFFGVLIGFDLKSIGEKFNHIWVLSVISLYAGIDLISKAMNK
tara:strand:- start:324 stop:512 length:189 start_codon:yes stop_codon:yes gene_type:complete